MPGKQQSPASVYILQQCCYSASCEASGMGLAASLLPQVLPFMQQHPVVATAKSAIAVRLIIIFIGMLLRLL